MEDYGEAINAVLRLLTIIENSPDEEIGRMSLILSWGQCIENALQDYEKTIPLRAR